MTQRSKWTHDMVLIAMFAVLIAVCSWISIPMTIPFTLQTLGVFLTCSLLGGKRATLTILIYILLGAVGLPVFSGMAGGIAVLLNTTGGYIVGFLASALVYWAVEAVFGRRWPLQLMSMIVGLIVCYAFGTIWYMILYTQQTGSIGLLTVLGYCVFPFIIPDLVKIALAMLLSGRIRKVWKKPI